MMPSKAARLLVPVLLLGCVSCSGTMHHVFDPACPLVKVRWAGTQRITEYGHTFVYGRFVIRNLSGTDIAFHDGGAAGDGSYPTIYPLDVRLQADVDGKWVDDRVQVGTYMPPNHQAVIRAHDQGTFYFELYQDNDTEMRTFDWSKHRRLRIQSVNRCVYSVELQPPG